MTFLVSWTFLELGQEQFEDIKGVIRIRKLKDRQHNDQQKKDKGTNSDLQNITQKIKDQATRTPLIEIEF